MKTILRPEEKEHLNDILSHFPEETMDLWEHFCAISQIPHPSGAEKQLALRIESWAHENKFHVLKDQKGNLVIRSLDGVGEVLGVQAHLDMVSNVRAGFEFDFTKSPLSLLIENQFLKAKNTTLGADNGIGVASGLALLMLDPSERPPIELILTVEEEIGLFGAKELKKEMISSKRLLNLDSEEWGTFIVGCAGGEDLQIKSSSLEWVTLKESMDEESSSHLKLTIQGLNGGHSGLEIHQPFQNALKCITQLISKEDEINFVSIIGGKAHNIIPSVAEIEFVVKDSQVQLIQEKIAQRFDEMVFCQEDQGAEIELVELQKLSEGDLVLSRQSHQDVWKFIDSIAHGVLYQSQEGVSASNNFAKLILGPQSESFQAQASLRFSNQREREDLHLIFERLAQQCHLDLSYQGYYPSWPRKESSKLLEKAQNLYLKTFQKDVNVALMHAGLECAVLADLFRDMDMISLGPDIFGAHSPDERVDIQSVNTYWTFLKLLVKELTFT